MSSDLLKYRSEETKTAVKKYSIDSSLVAPMPDAVRLAADLQLMRQFRPKQAKVKLAETAEQFLRLMPKAELHLHSTAMADIFVTAPLAWEISKKTDQKLQKLKQYKGSLENLIVDFLQPKGGSLEIYLQRYDLLKNYIIRDLKAVKHSTYCGAKQAYEAGVRLLEIRTSIKAGPTGDPRSKKIIKDMDYTPEQEIFARVEGFQKAEQESHGQLKCFLIISFRRQDSETNSKNLLNDVLRIRRLVQERYGRDYIVGVDIAGSEFQYKARKFESVFRLARDHGLKVTAHAGEEVGAGEGSIWQALNSGAQRIGHGTSLYLPWQCCADAALLWA